MGPLVVGLLPLALHSKTFSVLTLRGRQTAWNKMRAIGFVLKLLSVQMESDGEFKILIFDISHQQIWNIQ